MLNFDTQRKPPAILSTQSGIIYLAGDNDKYPGDDPPTGHPLFFLLGYTTNIFSSILNNTLSIVLNFLLLGLIVTDVKL